MAAAAIPVGMMVVGSLMKGKMEGDALDAQAAQAEQNARLSKEQAAYNAQKLMVMASKKIGSATAAYAASGIDSSQGSAAEVLRSSAMNAEMDRQNIIHGGNIRAMLYHSQAEMDREGSNATRTGSIFSAFGTGASGYAAIAGRGVAADPGADGGGEEGYTRPSGSNIAE